MKYSEFREKLVKLLNESGVEIKLYIDNDIGGSTPYLSLVLNDIIEEDFDLTDIGGSEYIFHLGKNFNSE